MHIIARLVVRPCFRQRYAGLRCAAVVAVCCNLPQGVVSFLQAAHGDALPAMGSSGASRGSRRTAPLRSAERRAGGAPSGGGSFPSTAPGMEKSASTGSYATNPTHISATSSSPYGAAARRAIATDSGPKQAGKSTSLVSLHRAGAPTQSSGTSGSSWNHASHTASHTVGSVKGGEDQTNYGLASLSATVAVGAWDMTVSSAGSGPSVAPSGGAPISKWPPDDSASGPLAGRSRSSSNTGMHSRAPTWAAVAGGGTSVLPGVVAGLPLAASGAHGAHATTDGVHTSPISSPASGRASRLRGAASHGTSGPPAAAPAASSSPAVPTSGPVSGRRRQVQPYTTAADPPASTAGAVEAGGSRLARMPSTATSINRHSLAPGSTAASCVLDPVQVTVGPRSGLTAKPGDVNEIVCDFVESSESHIRPVADGLRHVQCIASISWRGHNPTVFKINQVCN